MAARPIVIYDGECRFCLACVAWLRPRVDVRWVAASAWPDGRAGISPEQLASALHAVTGDQVEAGAGAVAAALAAAHSAWLRRLAWAIRLPGLRTGAEAVYRLVADHRGALSRLLMSG